MSQSPLHPQQFVAHRGDTSDHPENTLAALAAAIEAGAHFVEFDVQLSADRVPVVLHDEDLHRMAGVAGRVDETTVEALRRLEIRETGRRGADASAVTLATVEEAAALLAASPQVTAFVEIKPEIVQRWGAAVIVDLVDHALAAAREQCVVISFDIDAVTSARAAGWPVGLIIDRYDVATRTVVAQLEPEYVFAGVDRLPPTPELLWAGPWQWALYDAASAAHARELFARGADLLETRVFAAFMEQLAEA